MLLATTRYNRKQADDRSMLALPNGHTIRHALSVLSYRGNTGPSHDATGLFFCYSMTNKTRNEQSKQTVLPYNRSCIDIQINILTF